jgi:hypothetical protein
MALGSELFEFCHGLEFQATQISPWLGDQSYLIFPIAWSSEPSDFFLLLQD